MKTNKMIYKAVLFICFFFTTSLYAGDIGDEDPDTDDTGAAPIGDWVPLMLVVGTGLAIYYTAKNKTVKN